MERSGLLISGSNINPVRFFVGSDSKSCKFLCRTFNFRNVHPHRFRFSLNKVKSPTRRNPSRSLQRGRFSTFCFVGVSVLPDIELSNADTTISGNPGYARGAANFQNIEIPETSQAAASKLMKKLVLVDLDPTTAKFAIGVLGPFLSAFGFLFILRIVMSWYPKLPVEKFPYVIAYAPTEPLLIPTRKLIPPLGGVDVTPVVWFGLVSFLNEILVGPQGLLVLLSQKV